MHKPSSRKPSPVRLVLVSSCVTWCVNLLFLQLPLLWRIWRRPSFCFLSRDLIIWKDKAIKLFPAVLGRSTSSSFHDLLQHLFLPLLGQALNHVVKLSCFGQELKNLAGVLGKVKNFVDVLICLFRGWVRVQMEKPLKFAFHCSQTVLNLKFKLRASLNTSLKGLSD